MPLDSRRTDYRRCRAWSALLVAACMNSVLAAGGAQSDSEACSDLVDDDTARAAATTPRERPAVERLGLTLTDTLVVPDALYQRLARDVGAIKQRNPRLQGLHHRHAFDPSSLIVRAADDATADAIRNANYQGWSCLADAFGQTRVHLMFGRQFDLRFSGVYDIPALGERYAALPGIGGTTVNRNLGDGSTITVEREDEAYTYRFQRKWGNCPSGCANARIWIYRVDADGSVEVLAQPDTDAPQPPDWVE